MSIDARDAHRIGAIVLAAGRSSRFEGGHKLLADAGGMPLVRRAVTAVADSTADDIVLVTGGEAEAIRAAAGDGRWRTIHNPLFFDGLSASIRTGLAALPPGTAGSLIVLADMPGITSALIDRVLAAARANPAAIVHPLGPDGTQGHPVFWPSSLFRDLDALRGDSGAKSLLKAHAARVVTIDAGEADALSDIDTAADLDAFRRKTS